MKSKVCQGLAMILDASFTILFSKEGLFKVEFQFLFFDILDCLKLQSSTKVLARLPTFQYLSGKFISSPPSPRFNVV